MGVDQAIDLTAADRKTVLALLQRHLPGTAAWVYGSRVKWTSRPQSDLDLVVFATPEQQREVGDLREAFEESNLPFRVDLFVWGEVPAEFQGQIRTKHIVLTAGSNHPVLDRHLGSRDPWPKTPLWGVFRRICGQNGGLVVPRQTHSVRGCLPAPAAWG